MLARAADCTCPGISVQVFAMLAPDGGEGLREAITRAAAQVPRRHWEQRIDVLSVAESLQRLGLEDIACVEPTDGARPSHTTMMRR